jgi:hypothetical protein
MKRGPIWSSLGIRLGDALEAALHFPPDFDSLNVRVRSRRYNGGFRVARDRQPADELPPLVDPEETWDVDAELAIVDGIEFWFSGPLLDRRRLARALRAFVAAPEHADVLVARPRAPRTTRRIPLL